MSASKRLVIPAIISIIVIGIIYYVAIPPINVQSVQFWTFLIWCLITIGVCFGVPAARIAGTNFIEDLQREGINIFRFRRNRRSEGKGEKKKHGILFYILCLIIFLLLGLFVGNVASSPFFNARAYSGLLQTQPGDFSKDISEISLKNVPVVDRDTAMRLGSRTIGEISDLVSQYTIDESDNAYTQINYKNAPYRVSPLVYADAIKWMTNTANGLPGYVTVNMVTQETQLVRLPEGQYMHISTAEYFNNYLYRYVRFRYPTTMFGEAAFEIDDSGTPYWVVPTVTMRIGLFGGEDYDGAILVNACTGDTQRFELDQVPNWVDKVFNSSLINDQLSYYGKYQKGFWNSLIGQSGVLVPTGTSAPSLLGSSSQDASISGYNYLAIDDDVYLYTGMTSANSDESLVGFVLVNLQTKETKYYTCAGATESSAMSSAEGQVQQMNYNATSPLLLNIANRPTYFLSLKDGAGLVKMYAFIDVQQYQIVGTGSTIDEAEKNYVISLTNATDVDTSALQQSEAVPQKKGTIESIESVVISGNTYYYFKFRKDDEIYTAAISVSKSLPFYKAGDTIEVTYTEKDGSREVSSIS